MANRLSDEKATLIASEYCTNGYNKVQALLKSGYSVNYSNHTGLKLFDNERVKTAIERIVSANKAKSDETVESIRQKHLELYELAKKDQDLSTANQCLIAAGKTIAAYTDNLSNTSTQQAEPLSDDEKRILQEMADKMTKPTIKLKDVS